MPNSPTPSKRVLIAADHAGVELKAEIQKRLPDWQWEDLGPADSGRVDYPDYARKLTDDLVAGKAPQGVLICGSGIGMSIAANKVDGIRAALVENPSSARLAREHNDANVLCLGSRFLAPEYAAEIVETWLKTPFVGEAGGGRHQGRIDKIAQLEKRSC
jgi:ribose 5-phosphate isomerase B